jgi:hypothetical protein
MGNASGPKIQKVGVAAAPKSKDGQRPPGPNSKNITTSKIYRY